MENNDDWTREGESWKDDPKPSPEESNEGAKGYGLFFGRRFNSQFKDPYLFKIVRIIQDSLIKFYKINPATLIIEESPAGDSFQYCFENKNLNLISYLGRDKQTNKIVYLIQDKGRIKWAEMEGFCSPNYNRDWIFEKIGVIIQAKDLGNFASFLAGKKFETKGEYILAES